MGCGPKGGMTPMPKAARRVDESLVVSGSSARSITERVEIAMRGIDGYVITRPSPDIVQIAKVVRRLASRRTQICTVTVVSEPQRLVVALHGEIDDDRLESLKAAILGSSIEGLRDYDVSSFAVPAVTQPPAAAFEPSSDWFVTPIVPPVDSDHTVMRPASMSPVAATQTAKRTLALSMSDGRRFELTARMLIGRDPAPREGDDGACLVKLDDDAVSKTHAAFGRQGDSVWVEDRGSTNGSVLVDESGRHVALIPGQRVLLIPPATVVIGDTTISAIWL